MSEGASYVISGPEEDYNIPNVSVGKIIFDSLRNRNPNDVLNIDAITGDVLNCEKLLQESIKVTTILKNLGIKKGDVVTIINENTINYFIPVIATWYMGVVVNPLNPDYKEVELKHSLSITKPKLVLCYGNVLKSVLNVRDEFTFIETVVLMDNHNNNYYKVKSLEELTENISVDINSFKPEQFEPSKQGALILFSSGTTGLPKGVLLTHRNLREAIGYFSHPKYGNATSNDRTVTVLPFFHMFGFSVQLITMAIPMKSIVMNKFKSDLFLKSIQDYKATKLFIVPPILLFLAKSPLVDHYDISCLKDIIVGGASVGKEVQKQAMEGLGPVKLRQAYGLTETSGPCTIQAIDTKKLGGVGNLVPAVKAKICDPLTKQSIGPLQIGEICFKGPVVMKEYVGNKTATEESIDDDGFYHTGDLGFYNTDGSIYITDRMSEIIKCKGFQVSPVELEAILLTHPAIRECGVIGIPDERAGQVPLAFVVLVNGARVAKEAIIDYVAERISTQKWLYGGIRFIDEIPKTPSGKIIRQKLLKIFESAH